MAPIRSSTPIEKKRMQDISISDCSSVHSMETIDLTDSSDEEDQVMVVDSESENSQWASSYASTPDSRSTSSLDTIDLTSSTDDLDINANVLSCTSSIEADAQPTVNEPQQSAYNVITSDAFTEFIEQELKRVTEEIEEMERKKEAEKGADSLLSCSQTERLGGSDFEK